MTELDLNLPVVYWVALDKGTNVSKSVFSSSMKKVIEISNSCCKG